MFYPSNNAFKLITINIFFIVSFLLFNKTIFFNFFYSKKFSSQTFSLLKKNWKW